MERARTKAKAALFPPGSVEEVVAHLALWGSHPSWGLARVIYDDEFARRRAAAELGARLKEKGIPFHTIELPRFQPAEDVVGGLIEKLRAAGSGVVSVEGVATALPEDREVPLVDSLRLLNYNRERIAYVPVRQVWWMPRWFADLMQHAIPDLNSWFILRLRQTETGAVPRSASAPRPASSVALGKARARAQRLVDQAERALNVGESAEKVDREFLVPAVAALRSAGADPEADDLTRRFAVRFAERAVRPDDFQSLHNLADAYRKQGRYADAEPLLRRVLDDRLRRYGPDHLDAATSLNNLAYLYKMQGRATEAEPLYRRALEIRERVLGPDHPDTALSLNNLASLYESQGRAAEAEPLHRRALEIRERVLGPDHPDTATSLNNLALLYEDQGRAAEAEPLHRRALEIRERVLGPDHPDTATSLNNLALLYEDQGRAAEAEPLFRRALDISERVLGPDHPDTAMSLNNLAVFYDSQGRATEAEPLYRRALEIREARLGPDHPKTRLVRENLDGCRANLYGK